MASGAVYRGMNQRISFNGTNANMDTVSLDLVADDIPAIGFEDVYAADVAQPDYGTLYDDGATGVVGATLGGRGYWDATLNPQPQTSGTTNSVIPLVLPGLKVGAYIPSVRQYVSRFANRFYFMTYIRVLSARVGGEVRGRVDFNFNSKTCGRIIYPT